MRRREFIATLGSAATWPVVALGQTAMPVIGFLSSRSPAESSGVVAAFREGLRERGFIEGQNVGIAFRWADGRYDRLPALVAELIDLKVTVIFAAGGPPSALAAKTATSTIPIVFSAASDSVGLGLVASLNKPGANVTGMSTLTSPLGAKGIELLKELMPNATSMAYLINPSNPSGKLELDQARIAADALKIELRVIYASTEPELDEAFSALPQPHTDGLIVAGEPFFDSQREKIVRLAARSGVPTGYAWRENVLIGGLMSYGNSLPSLYRQAANYVGRVLKGEKPADLPVMQPTKFELAINLKTAKALGLTVPPTLLARADEVIE
jgi:putative ABC transport system substrate-binding protein